MSQPCPFCGWPQPGVHQGYVCNLRPGEPFTRRPDHVPAPWIVRENATGTFGIVTDAGREIASVTAYPWTAETSAANADVIAAAPDLLAVAQAIATLPETGVSVEHCMRLAKAALGKIES